MYPASPFTRFRMDGPHFVPFLSPTDPTWLVLRRIHLCRDPRGATVIYNHRATCRIDFDASTHPPSDQDSQSDNDDRSDDDDDQGNNDDQSDDAAALCDASDLDFYEAASDSGSDMEC